MVTIRINYMMTKKDEQDCMKLILNNIQHKFINVKQLYLNELGWTEIACNVIVDYFVKGNITLDELHLGWIYHAANEKIAQKLKNLHQMIITWDCYHHCEDCTKYS